MDDVTVIIVTHDSQDVVVEAINSILNNINIKQVFVVDNESKDLTCEYVERINSNKINLIRARSNKGFGAANNMALEKVQTPYVLLLNPDAIMQEGALEKLIEKAKEFPEAALLAPQILLTDGEVQRSYKKTLFDREKNAGSFVIPRGDLCSEFLSGAVMFLVMDRMKEVGGFDEHIFLFYEDDDLCLRIRRAGFSLVWVADAYATHLMGQSAPYTPQRERRKQYHLSWSRLYMEHKYRGANAAYRKAIYAGLFFVCKCVMYGVLCRKRKLVRYWARLAGVIDFVKGKQCRM